MTTDQLTQDLAMIARNAIDRILELERQIAERTVSQLVNVDDIAKMFGVGRLTVAKRWVHKPGFPAPAFEINRQQRLWNRAEIIAWAQPAKRKKPEQRQA